MAWSDMIEGLKGQVGEAGNSILNQAKSKAAEVTSNISQKPDMDLSNIDIGQMTSGMKIPGVDEYDLSGKDLKIGGASVNDIVNYGKTLGIKKDKLSGMTNIETPGRSIEIGGMKFNINSVRLNGKTLDFDNSDIKLDQGTGNDIMGTLTGGNSLEQLSQGDLEGMSPEEIQAKVDEAMNQGGAGMDPEEMIKQDFSIKFDSGTQKMIDKFNFGKLLK